MKDEYKETITGEITFRSLNENFHASIIDYQDLVIRVSGLSNAIKVHQELAEPSNQLNTPVISPQENSVLQEFAEYLNRINELNHRLLAIVHHLEGTLG